MLFKRGNSVNSRNFTILLCAILVLILFISLPTLSRGDEPESVLSDDDSNHDMLAYTSNEHDLLLHNPVDRTTTRILANVASFVMSPTGRVAYTRIDEDDTDIYVYDSSLAGVEPINITQNPTSNHYPIAWSPDGEYLAFVSYQERNEDFLHVWDGETITNIVPDGGLDTANSFSVDWSYDGRLAFTVNYGPLHLDPIPNEIYLWDGTTTTSLSQNPKGQDGGVQWSRNGQLMFWSGRDDESGIYIWDGMSFRDGLPDIASFIRLAPELEPFRPIWLVNGFIGFTVSRTVSDSGRKEIVIWDWENEQIIQQFPVVSDNAWSWLAEGGQMVISSQVASGLPSFDLDIENIEGEILFSGDIGDSAWSSDDYLAYCGIEDRTNFILTIWDGEESWVVDKIHNTPARWLYGEHSFSCNNG